MPYSISYKDFIETRNKNIKIGEAKKQFLYKCNLDRFIFYEKLVISVAAVLNYDRATLVNLDIKDFFLLLIEAINIAKKRENDLK